MATAAPMIDPSMAAQASAPSPEQMAAFEQMRQSISPKEMSDELLSSASQIEPQAVAEFKKTLEEMDVPPEVLDMLNNLVDEVLANPENYDAIKEKYRAQGVTEDILPEEFDPQFFAALNMAVDQLRGEPAGPQAFAKGGIAELSPVTKAIAAYGRNGDTMLAHITPAEARMLKKRGGAGTINPVTGLPEFANIFSKIGSAIKKFASSTVGRLVTTVALGFLIGPAAASMLGVSSVAGVAAVSGFVGSAGSTLLGGGSIRDALKAGAIGGLTAGVGAGVMGGADAFASGSYTGPTTVGGQFDRAVNALTPGAPAPALPSQPTLPEAPTLPGQATLPGAEAPSIGVPDKYDLLPEAQGHIPARQPADWMPPQTATQAPAQVAPSATSPATVGAPKVPTLGQGIETLGKGLGIGEGQSFDFNKVMEGAKQVFSPSLTPDQLKLTPEYADAMSKGKTMVEALSQAAKAYDPGLMRTYGPGVAAGLGIMGLTGGFKTREVTSPYAGLFTGGPGSAKDLMAKNPYQYYVQGLPGVTYYGGSVLPPGGYAAGGSVSDEPNTDTPAPPPPPPSPPADDPRSQTPPITGATAVAPPPVAAIGTAAAPVQVETQAVGGYNTYSPGAMNLYYNELNKGLLSGTKYDPVTQSNVPIINPGIYSGNLQQKADYYNSLLNKGFTDAQIRAAVTPQTDSDWSLLQKAASSKDPIIDPGIYSATPGQKADYYNQMRARGFTDAQLRAAVSPQTDSDWTQLQNLAGARYLPGTPPPSDLTVRQEIPQLFFPSSQRLAEIENTYRSTLGRDPTAQNLMLYGNPQSNLSISQVTSELQKTPEYAQYQEFLKQRDKVDKKTPTTPPRSVALNVVAPPTQMMPTAPGTSFAPTVMPPTEEFNLRYVPPGGTGGGRGNPFVDTMQMMNTGGIASLGTGGYPRRTGQIDGPGTETSDSIPAMLSDGEFVMTAKAVRAAGGGDRRKGAKKMYALMHRLERNASRG